MLANGILIRPATNGDHRHLAAMLSDFADYLNAISPVEFDNQKIDYLVDLSLGSDPVRTTCLAERGEVAIGYVTFCPCIWEIYRAQYVVSLFVRPAARLSDTSTALMEIVRESGRMPVLSVLSGLFGKRIRSRSSSNAGLALPSPTTII